MNVLIVNCFLIFLLGLPFFSFSEIKLPSIFSDGMVLQRESDVNIWGESDGMYVNIAISWDTVVYHVKVNDDGTWKAQVRTGEAGGPFTISVADDNSEVVLTDVLLGEVWLASGQSNMEMPLKGFKNQPVDNASDVLQNSENNRIRFFEIENTSWAKPLRDVNGLWKAAAPQTAPDFSATAYFFALSLFKKLDIPIAVISADWGGTMIQAWMSADTLAEFSEVMVKPFADSAYTNKNEPTGLYNGMIHPIVGYGIRGAIWYQGEQNRHEPELYQRLFPAMVSQWRADWGIGDFPFYYVQIAPHIFRTPDKLPEKLAQLAPYVPYLREAQLKSEKIIPNTGMAVLMDVGSVKTIHPPDKESVGVRLSYQTLHKTYGFRDVAYSGPIYQRMTIDGSSIILYFDHAEGLYLADRASANFEIAGDDRMFYPAVATVEGTTVSVYSDQVEHPVSVRYAFKAWAQGDLLNKDNLPASSFRIDNWPINNVIRTESNSRLVSGQPIPNASTRGSAFFCLPSYSASIMGMADANSDGVDDLWIQSTNSSERGVFLYLFSGYGKNGVPSFSGPLRITVPFEDKGKNKGIIFQEGRNIYAIWRFGTTLKWSMFDMAHKAFRPFGYERITELPPRITDFGLVQSANQFMFLFSVRDSGVFGPETAWPRVVSYTPEGFWPYKIPMVGIKGFVTDSWKEARVDAQPFTAVGQAYYALQGFSPVKRDRSSYILTGSRFGNIYAYPLKHGKFGERAYIVDKQGKIMRQPTTNTYLSYFEGKEGPSGIIAQGEGGIYFYEDLFQTDQKGNLVFGVPVPLLQDEASLYGGSLVVPNLVDWDNDGVLDIVSGTSTGHLLFFKNKGTNDYPLMQNPVNLVAGGESIHIQGGYRESIQGPGEAKWGYTCPSVVDWNGDDLPDIVLGDIRGKFTVYINEGSRKEAKLKSPQPIYHNGLEMHGSWRVRPGVGKLAGKMAFINQDIDDELHLYWQIDEFNVIDGGKLRMEDGRPIKGARLPAGAVGRTRIEVIDWDGDGIKDLLLGTYGKQSIPEPMKGFPFHFSKRGSTPLFLKNIGTEESPVFAYPKPILFKGERILHGGHECGVTAAYFGPGNSLNMIVGEENGKYIFYQREDLSW